MTCPKLKVSILGLWNNLELNIPLWVEKTVNIYIADALLFWQKWWWPEATEERGRILMEHSAVGQASFAAYNSPQDASAPGSQV